MWPFLISNMVLGLTDQLQIFWQLYLIELLGTFNRSKASQAVALDISKAFARFWHADLLHKLMSYGILGQTFCLISSFLSNRCLWAVLNGKSSQEYFVNARVPQGSTLDPALFLLYINDLSDDGIGNITIYADEITFYSNCCQTSDQWQQLELASELKSDQRDTGLGQEVAYCFQFLKSSTGFLWPAW